MQQEVEYNSCAPSKFKKNPLMGTASPQQYTVKSNLGVGGFGTVYLVQDKKDWNKLKALKRTQKIGKFTSREIEMLQLLKGKPNIVQMDNYFYS